jgi:hypothetical protein
VRTGTTGEQPRRRPERSTNHHHPEHHQGTTSSHRQRCSHTRLHRTRTPQHSGELSPSDQRAADLPEPPADINSNGRVAIEDFSILLFNWTG